MRDYSYMIGNKYGNWLINSVFYIQKGKINRPYANCTCICGNEKSVRIDGILKGLSTNCGCIKYSNLNKKHGGANTRLYRIWLGMKARCYNSKNPEYKNYGGRGILISEEWMDFSIFREWALNNGYAENLTIERIDVNSIYCKENCKWITKSEQLKNTTKTIFITYKGETLCAMDWSKKLGIPNNVLIHRYKSGLPLDLVFSKTRFKGKSFNNIKEINNGK